jgi:hypothetical protein
MPVASDQMVINNELETIWKEAVIAYFKVVSRHLPGRTDKKTHKKLQSEELVFQPRFKLCT